METVNNKLWLDTLKVFDGKEEITTNNTVKVNDRMGISGYATIRKITNRSIFLALYYLDVYGYPNKTEFIWVDRKSGQLSTRFIAPITEEEIVKVKSLINGSLKKSNANALSFINEANRCISRSKNLTPSIKNKLMDSIDKLLSQLTK